MQFTYKDAKLFIVMPSIGGNQKFLLMLGN